MRYTNFIAQGNLTTPAEWHRIILNFDLASAFAFIIFVFRNNKHINVNKY